MSLDQIVIAKLNWADMLMIGIIVVSAIIGLFRGFVREAWSLFSWVVAAVCAVRFAAPLSDYFKSFIHTPSIRVFCAGASILVVVLILGGLLGFLLGQLVSKTGLSGTDRLLGMLFGLARGVLLVAVILMVAKLGQMSGDPWWKGSQLLPMFMPLVNWLQVFLPEKLSSVSSMISGHGKTPALLVPKDL